ncbi:MAG: hypothetical protein U9M98_02555 [Patescibacteria group bacterium]|nr:hypothetical protein [Patescibacteria group bacterium]
MGAYTDTISRLISYSASPDSSLFFLSAYLPKKGRNKDEVNKHVKSHIFSVFRNHQELKKYKDLRHAVVKAVQTQVDLLDTLRQGLAIFVKVNLDKLTGAGSEIPEEDVFVLALNRAPRKELRIGKTFDLDQLVWMNNVAATALVMSLQGKEAKLYCIDLGGIKPETKQQVPVEVKEEPEYLEQFSPIDFRGMYHGTGSEKVSRRREMEREQLLRDVKEAIKTKMVPSNYKFLIIYASSNFSELVPSLVNDPTIAPASTRVVVEEKTIEDETALKKDAREKVAQAQEEQKEQFLNRAREVPDRYVEGWQDVVREAREGSIGMLFVKPDLEMHGSVLDEEFPHLQKYPGSREVTDLAPWVVRRVVRTDGEVVVWRGPVARDLPDIAAFLRYRKES